MLFMNDGTKKHGISSLSNLIDDGISKTKTEAAEATKKAIYYANYVDASTNLTNKLKSTKEKVSDFFDEKDDKYQVSQTVKDKIGALDEVTRKELGKIVETTGDTLDIISGAKIMRDVEDMIYLQKKYNDILATKLEETLQRVSVLEEILNNKK